MNNNTLPSEQELKYLKSINEHCINNNDCRICRFGRSGVDNDHCMIKGLPKDWKVEK